MEKSLEELIKFERDEKIKSLEKARQLMDPLAFLDYQFLVERSDQLITQKREKVAKDFELIIEEDLKRFQKYKDKAIKSKENRENFFKSTIFRGSASNWSGSMEERYGIVAEPGYHYISHRVKHGPLDFNTDKYRDYEFVMDVEQGQLGDPEKIYRRRYDKHIINEGKPRALQAQLEVDDHIFNYGPGRPTGIKSGLLQLYNYSYEATAYVLTQCYPSITEYEGNRAAYPHFIKFLEVFEGKFEPDMVDFAIRKWLGFGTPDYAEKMVEHLKEVAKINSEPNGKFKYKLKKPMSKSIINQQNLASSTLGMPTPNPAFNPVSQAQFDWCKPNPDPSYPYGPPKYCDHLPLHLAAQIADDYNSVLRNYRYFYHKHTDVSDLNELREKYPFLKDYNNKNWSNPIRPLDSAPLLSENDQVVWWWNRPKSGYVYVHGVGYVNPFYFRKAALVFEKTEFYYAAHPSTGDIIKRNIEKLKPFFNAFKSVAEGVMSGNISKAISASTFIATGGKYSSLFDVTIRTWSSAAGNVWKVLTKIYTGAYLIDISEDVLNIELRKQLNEFTGGFLDQVEYFYDFPGVALRGEPITQEDWNVVMSVGIKGAIIAFSGGTAASVISVGSSQLQQGTLGQTDLGKGLLSVGEVYAIAASAGTSVSAAVEKKATQLAIGVLVKEAGQATGLDKTIIGRLTLDITSATIFGLTQDKAFMNALADSADKAWRMSAARQSPYAALLLAGVTDIQNKGIDQTLTDLTSPEQWFKSYSWEELGDEIADFARGIDSKDVMFTAGLAMMIASGQITEEQALLMGVQQASIRHIDRFYQDKPVYGPMTLEQAKEEQITRDVGRYKQGQALLTRVSKGIPPTKEDVLFISDNVAGPLYDSIKEYLPTKYQAKGWEVALDIGIPNFPSILPNPDIEVPKWMKLKKAKYPLLDTKAIEDEIGKKLTAEVELTREDIVAIILGLLPRQTPLVPGRLGGEQLGFNYIDMLGKLYVREPLIFPFDHPMLKYGSVPKKYTKDQLAYVNSRKKEMDEAYEKIAKAEAYALELMGSKEEPLPLGMG